MNDFYIGYLPEPPANLRDTLRRTVWGLMAAFAAIAIVLVLAQSVFPSAAFDFTDVREFDGILEVSPYPALLVHRPGSTADAPYSRYVLVAEGKRGADDQVRGRSGQLVRLRGKLIYRDDQTLLELMPGSIEQIGVAEAPKPVDLGWVSLTGEIVDTKCYAGVMNPGQGKVHRECAARCISGGIPPALLVRSSDGASRLYYLAATNGRPVGKELLRRVAESVTLKGHLVRRGETETLLIDAQEL
jgi:hypothetical protein